MFVTPLYGYFPLTYIVLTTYGICLNSTFKGRRNPINKIWWLGLVPTSTTRFASDVGYRMAKSCIVLYIYILKKEIIFMNNDIKFLDKEWRTPYPLTNFEDLFGLRASVIFYTQICGVSCSFGHWLDSKLQWSIDRTNCSYYSTRVGLYSHQVLLYVFIFSYARKSINPMEDLATNTIVIRI